MRAALALVAALLLLAVPATAQADRYTAYLLHQQQAMTDLTAAVDSADPEELVRWGTDQLAWHIANPPEPCYAAAFTVGVAVGEAVRASGFMASDPWVADTVGVLYINGPLQELFNLWVATLGTVSCE